MSVMVAVQVPVEEAADLDALSSQMSAGGNVTTVRPFDGAAMAQIIVPVTVASLAFLKVWLKARVDQRKNVKIVKDGVEYTGLNDEQVDRVLGIIEAETAEDES